MWTDPPSLGLVGAFAFPVPQGSQVFAREQMRALEAAGARTAMFCYGRGVGSADVGARIVRTPRWSTPRSHAAGPRLRKPVADAALFARLLQAARRERFDAWLAHNAEAAAVAIAARPFTGVPVVYVAHTLLADELPEYTRPGLADLSRRFGRGVDRSLAARADAVLALGQLAARRLAPPRAPLAVIPPGLDARPIPGAELQREWRARLSIPEAPLVLYAGNLDAYQDVDLLRRVAEKLPSISFVAATHDPPRDLGRVRVLRVPDDAALRALSASADLALLPRRPHGGFPVKLLNYMEAALPIVAREGLVDSLLHGRNAWLVPDDAGAEVFADAITALLAQPERAAALGRAARRTLEEEHAWPALAKRTLALVEAARGSGTLAHQ